MNDLERDLAQAMDEAADEALNLARRYSSGTFPMPALRRMGHPYARRHGTPRRDPSIINAQTGQFVKAWKKRHIVIQGGEVIAQVVNESPHAAFLNGTRFMFDRPVEVRVEHEIEDVAADIIGRHLGG